MISPRGLLGPGGEMIPFFRGRAALYHLLDALGVGPGDEVAVQAYTCLAVPLPIIGLGATPIYVDINSDDLGMNVEDLRRKVGPRTRAVVIQHTFGIPANAPALAAVAAEVGAVVIEDCCHVLGGGVSGHPVGSFGAAAFYSFEWGKPLVAGVGGGLVVRCPELRQDLQGRVRHFSNPPLSQRLVMEAQYWAYTTLLTGRSYWTVRSLYNRLSGLGVLVGTFGSADDVAKPDVDEYSVSIAPRTARRLAGMLRRIDDIVAHQEQLANHYVARLTEYGLPVWRVPAGRNPVFMRYPFLSRDKAPLLEAARGSRVELHEMFESPIDPLRGVAGTAVGYIEGSCPGAEEACRRIVSAPIGPRISEAQVARTVEFLDAHRAMLLGGHAVADSPTRDGGSP